MCRNGNQVVTLHRPLMRSRNQTQIMCLCHLFGQTHRSLRREFRAIVVEPLTQPGKPAGHWSTANSSGTLGTEQLEGLSYGLDKRLGSVPVWTKWPGQVVDYMGPPSLIDVELQRLECQEKRAGKECLGGSHWHPPLPLWHQNQPWCWDH